MKKILLILVMSMFLLNLVSAENSLSSSKECSIGLVKQGDIIELTQTCFGGCKEVNLTKIMFPNKSVLLLGKFSMTENGSNYNFTFSNTNTLGIYSYSAEGIDPNNNSVGQSCSFEVTYSGLNFGVGQAILYIIFFFMLLFTFIITLFGINMLPKHNQQDEEGRILSVTYLKYLRPVGWMFEYMLVVAMFFMTSNIAFAYLNEQLFAKVLFMFFVVLFGFAPLIIVVWIAWIFVQMFHDKQFQEMLNRGIFPQGKNY